MNNASYKSDRPKSYGRATTNHAGHSGLRIYNELTKQTEVIRTRGAKRIGDALRGKVNTGAETPDHHTGDEDGERATLSIFN